MSYLVLSRKWRPQTFADVVGQEHVTRTLCNAIRSGRVAHAFLFTGPRGVGKTTMARLLAKALNCEQGPTPDPCNTCSNCLEITAGNALDVLEIDGASHTGVDNIRDLTEGVQYRPVKSRFRVVIIDEVHMLSNAAFNALLKTLEEPPLHVKFIFATTEAHKVLQTILSRCQRYDFQRIALRELIQRLQVVAEGEGLSADEVGLALLAREADGSLRDAESLLDQVVAWSGGSVNEQAVKEALGVADRQALFRVVEAVLARDPAQALRLAGDLYQYGYDPRRLCRDLLEHFRHLVIAKISPDPVLLAELPDHEVATVRQQAGARALEDLQRLFALMLRAEEEVSRTAYTQLVIEMTLVKLASQPPVMPIDEALAQLEALRRKLGGNPQEPTPAGQHAAPPAPPVPPPAPPVREHAPSPRPTTPVVREHAAAPSAEAALGAEAEQQSVWERFLAAVQKEKISLFFALKSGHFLGLTPTTLQIGVDKDPYFKELTRTENRTLLEETARRCFGRDLKVEVTKGSTLPAAAASPVAMAAQSHKPQEQQTEGDPLVKTVLDVLGGEVQATRSRPASEPHNR
ncbi:MAG: DNA polymerase III subunit gamma/tau [Deltaproteobacteria bacterium]|nr:MAG: DNA polymerase III subunit gamma/tau [Deltaproteobacteria bacterium]